MTTSNDTCPFRMQAGMLLDGQRSRIHGVGEGKPVPIDVSCIGPSCMGYVVTGLHPETKKPIGGCGIAVGPVFLVQLGERVRELNSKIDTLTVAMTEAIEGEAPGPTPTILTRFAAKLRTFFQTPETPTPSKPRLAAVPAEKP